MAVEDYFTTPITILLPGSKVDRYGNAAVDWSTATSVDEKAWVTQRSTITEQTRAAVAYGRLGAIETTLHLMLAVDSAIVRYARVVVAGQTYDVLGDPDVANTPAGPHHIEVDIMAVEG